MATRDSIPLRKNVRAYGLSLYYRDDVSGKGAAFSVYDENEREILRFDAFPHAGHMHINPLGENLVTNWQDGTQSDQINRAAAVFVAWLRRELETIAA